MILTVDMGTTATKVALWDVDGLVALSSTPLTTRHPAPGWAEQDPAHMVVLGGGRMCRCQGGGR